MGLWAMWVGKTPVRRWILSTCILAAGCSGPSEPPRAAKPTAAPSPTSEMDDPEVQREAAESQGGLEMSGLALEALRASRDRLLPVKGSARFQGNSSDFLQLAAALPETDVGFGSFKFLVDCDAPDAPTVCAVARAYPPDIVRSMATILERIGARDTEIIVEGRADLVWKLSGKPKVYGGECGEIECEAGAEKIAITKGMPVDSNVRLACLRALCVFSESGLRDSGWPARIVGQVTSEGSRPESRRAELRLFTRMPKVAHVRFWSEFRNKVGHER